MRILLIIFTFTFCPSLVLCQWSLTAEVSSQIDEYVTYTMKKRNIPGLALAVVEKGEVLKKATYGVANLEYRVPVADSSTFWLASVSKHITATAIMQLYEKGVIELDLSIHNYLPDIPKIWKSITIRHLLSHTSGLPESGKGNERGHRSANGTLSAEQMYENAKKDTLSFTPGDRFLYSDEGFFLLGYIIHKVSGSSFKDYMFKEIFEPANMHTAYLMDHFKVHPNQVSGYSLKDGVIIPDRNSWRLIDTEINAAGGVFASINDMIEWDKAMNSSTLITEASKDKMWTTATLNNGCETDYSFAWNTQLVNEEKVIYHPGIAGTEYLRFLDRRLNIIVLTNQVYMGRSIALDIADLLGIPSSIIPSGYKTGNVDSYTFGEHEILNLTGLYQFISNENYFLGPEFRFQVSIKKEGNELIICYPSNEKYPVKYQLVKLDNKRIAQLSWYPVFLEMSYLPTTDGGLLVFENYGCDEEIQIGELRKVEH